MTGESLHGDALNRHACSHSDATVPVGKPVIKGTGLSVQCLPESIPGDRAEQRVPESDPQLRAHAPRHVRAGRRAHMRRTGLRNPWQGRLKLPGDENDRPVSAKGQGNPGHRDRPIAGHSPEVSEETVPRLSRARGRAIIMFDRDHREQLPGGRLPVPAGILHLRFVSGTALEVTGYVSGLLSRCMKLQRRIATSDKGGIRQKLSERRATVGPPVRERRRRGPSEGAFGPIEKTGGPNQRTAGLLLGA